MISLVNSSRHLTDIVRPELLYEFEQPADIVLFAKFVDNPHREPNPPPIGMTVHPVAPAGIFDAGTVNVRIFVCE